MYTFSSKLKTFSLILMLLGALGIGYGFLTAPKDIQEVEILCNYYTPNIWRRLGSKSKLVGDSIQKQQKMNGNVRIII
jgi:hypothetical protein